MQKLKNWEMVEETPFKAGFRRLLNRVFILPNGKKDNFDIKDEGPAVCILALTSDNKVIMTKQFRPGPMKILIEMPGGYLEKGENPLDAANRELLEETGYAGNLEYVSSAFDCAYSTMIRHVFVARNCERIQEQKLDPLEFINVIKMSLADFRKYLMTGQSTDIECGYLGLDFLGLL